MRRHLPHVPNRVRFAAGYVLVGVLAFGGVVAFAAQLKAGTQRPQHTQSHQSQGCVSVGCAQLGDHVAYVLEGTVSQVSSPQPGVVCVQVGARTHAGDYCALK